LVRRALEAGARVVVLDNLSAGEAENLPDAAAVELVVGNVCDDALVGRLVRQCDLVAHLAAGVGVGRIVARPTLALRESLFGTEAVMRHCAAARRPVFLASSSEVYGDGTRTPLREERCVGFGSSERIRFTYAAGKAAGEALAFAYAHEYGLPVVVGRFFNVTGPRQRGAVVPSFVEQALDGGPLHVHGDGNQTRSFLDVRDAAEYVWRLVRAAPADGLLVNVGRAAPITIGDLAARVRDLVDPSLRIESVAPAYGPGFAPIRHRRPDPSRLVAYTGYEPRYSLDETLRACITHHRAARSPR
ncbi:MAG: NAD-dependent epimerase/dehydratase family protein, partial [Planctomycetota bacterium]|nr:NAD-dependent epimerase/dehydratase family protein [Planctomycetota bacterium]